jgi:Tol biopolymer transport system component
MVYASGRHVWTYDLSANRGTQLVTGHQPAWYPSGEKIIFIRRSEGDEGVRTAIWSMNVDGTGLTEIVSSNEQALFLHPTVSPEGEKIAYVKATLEQDDVSLSVSNDEEEGQSNTIGSGDQFGNLDIFVSSVDGTDRVRLTTHPLPDIQPDWVSESQIVYTSERPKSTDIENRNWNVWVLSL